MASSYHTAISATALGSPAAQDELLGSIAGGNAFVPLSKAVAQIRDPATNQDVEIVVNAFHQGGSTVSASIDSDIAVDDLMIAVCKAFDAASVRAVMSKIWRALDATPHWQPVCLLVTYSSRAHPATASADARAAFAQALRELDERLERQLRFYGCFHVRLDDEVVVPEDALKNAANQAATVWSLPEALIQWVDLVKAPTHVIFDRRASAFTVAGQRALRRAFWLLDRDVDGSLSDAEILLWQNKMYATATDDDITSVKAFLRDAVAADGAEGASQENNVYLAPNGGVTVDGFLAVCFAMLSNGNAQLIWAMLDDSGIQRDGLPFSPEQLKSVPSREDASIQLSLSGVQFFSNLYSKRRFVSSAHMWDFVPDCPWESYPGLPLPANDLTRDEFVDCWRVLATLNPTAVAEFAFYWGYNSDAGLLFVSKAFREDRVADRDWPTTLQVLVVGSHRVGKTSLVRRLGSDVAEAQEQIEAFAEEHPCCETIHAVTIPRNGVATTVVFHEITDMTALSAIEKEEVMRRFDGVLLCCSPSDDDSIDFMLDAASVVVRHAKLPIALALTKADLPHVALATREKEVIAALARIGLPWCPFVTSLRDDECQALGIVNDVDGLVVTLTDAIHCPEATRLPQVPLSRKIRRVAVVSIGVVLVGLAIKRILRRNRS